MEEFDRSYLHPLLEHPKQSCPSQGLNLQPPAPHAGTLAKSYSNSLHCFVIRNLYMAALLQVAVTHDYYCGRKLECRPNNTCKFLPLTNQVLASLSELNYVGVTIIDELNQSYPHPILEQRREPCLGRGLKPMAKSY
jgi:hypothetical protein